MNQNITTYIAALFLVFGLNIGLLSSDSRAQEGSFTTSNDRSLFDAQTRALRQKARTQLETDTAKLKDLKQTNEDLDSQTDRIKICADLDKVYNGDPTGSNNSDTYCQGIVGAIPSELNFKGLAAWYDISTEEGYVIRDGYTDKVAELLDKSGNLNHLYHNYSPPTIRVTDNYQDKANANMRVIAFEGFQNMMSSKSDKMATATGIKGDAAVSIFAVAASNANDSQAHGLFNIGGDAGTLLGLFVNTKYSLSQGPYGVSAAGGSTVPVINDRMVLMDFHRDSGENFDFYLNGQSFAFSNMTRPINIQDGRMHIGAVGANYSNYTFKGDFAEFILYNRELTTIERASVQTYLINKHGLQPFSNCASKTINSGQCSVTTGNSSHGTLKTLSCAGTYGTCLTQQLCNDGVWEEKLMDCPAPVNCTTSSTRSISGECNASTGTGNHAATANLSCTGSYGACTAKSDCFNGAWGSAYDINCPSPNPCANGGKTVQSGGTWCKLPGTATWNSGIPSYSVEASGTTGGTCIHGGAGCSYTCNNGSWGLNSHSCNLARCAGGQIINGCKMVGEFTGFSNIDHGDSGGTCNSPYSGACDFSCNNGSWTENSNSCSIGSPCSTTDLTLGTFPACTIATGALAHGERKSVTCLATFFSTSNQMVADAVCNNGVITKENERISGMCGGTVTISHGGASCSVSAAGANGTSAVRSCTDSGANKVVQATITCNEPNSTVSNLSSSTPASCGTTSKSGTTLSASSGYYTCTIGSEGLEHSRLEAANHYDTDLLGCYSSDGDEGWLEQKYMCNNGTWVTSGSTIKNSNGDGCRGRDIFKSVNGSVDFNLTCTVDNAPTGDTEGICARSGNCSYRCDDGNWILSSQNCY